MSKIKEIIFGKTANGERLSFDRVSFTTVYPDKKLTYNQWSIYIHNLLNQIRT